ncbi:hypothetical protein CXG81DRAFT_20556 [Caulochytrium protostelioides]|uniref:Uncharacterized protein n=1 Tax=Caulochytrium protostelioides TaxID=1555241 RepID=A0A4P9X2V7_9FUNG|nr:hypothetical protein CXG81DRAFT_20556 [Caulochytrium protostelioides]|eukprot:RKO99350.1 hypothetical protein CXG81DRAFT_20556 [Caulochytrium protostelioides]
MLLLAACTRCAWLVILHLVTVASSAPTGLELEPKPDWSNWLNSNSKYALIRNTLRWSPAEAVVKYHGFKEMQELRANDFEDAWLVTGFEDDVVELENFASSTLAKGDLNAQTQQHSTQTAPWNLFKDMLCNVAHVYSTTQVAPNLKSPVVALNTKIRKAKSNRQVSLEELVLTIMASDAKHQAAPEQLINNWPELDLSPSEIGPTSQDANFQRRIDLICFMTLANIRKQSGQVATPSYWETSSNVPQAVTQLNSLIAKGYLSDGVTTKSILKDAERQALASYIVNRAARHVRSIYDKADARMTLLLRDWPEKQKVLKGFQSTLQRSFAQTKPLSRRMWPSLQPKRVCLII